MFVYFCTVYGNMLLNQSMLAYYKCHIIKDCKEMRIRVVFFTWFLYCNDMPGF